MPLFKPKDNYLGIDLGTSSIKMVELANFNGRPRLVTYGFTERSLGSIGNNDTLINNIDQTAAVILDICKKSKATAKKVVTALPNYSVFTSILNLPDMPKKDLASAITWEAKKIIPIPLEEIILDWKIIEETSDSPVVGANIAAPGSVPDMLQANNPIGQISSKSKKNLKILLTGANKGLIRKYIEIFNKTGLNLLSLETENFALIRSLVGNDKSVIMVIDIGASTSSITVVDKGIPFLSRSIDIGGFSITRAISNSLNVSMERAEQFKQDLSLDMETADNSLPQTVEKAFIPILNEIKYTINLYQEANNKKVEKIILSGGSALLGHLTGYVSSSLNVNAYIGDPWARTIFPVDLKPILDRIGSRFAVSVGLAMRDIE